MIRFAQNDGACLVGLAESYLWRSLGASPFDDPEMQIDKNKRQAPKSLSLRNCFHLPSLALTAS
jgi:hypothetical protein